MSGVLLVLAGGAVGAPARYLLDLWVQSRHESAYPWGTWTINVLGSLVLGGVAAATAEAVVSSWVLTLVGVGLCGAFTTFSTFAVESVRLVDQGRVGLAAAYVASSVAVGLAACSLGWWAVSAV